MIAALARHHLLLPDTATRRDLDDPMTITIVTEAVGGSAELLDLLHALSIADAAATGPARVERLEGRADRRTGAPRAGRAAAAAELPSRAAARRRAAGAGRGGRAGGP